MRLTSRGIDEYTLAAYLAGRLSPSRRKEVADFLARNEDARDLLHAASQLLESEGDGQSTGRPVLSSVSLPARRKPLLSPSKRLSVTLWTLVAMVCLTAFATTMLVAFRAGIDAGSAEVAVTQVDPSRMMAIQGGFGSLAWLGHDGAAFYRIVVWDDAEAAVVAQIDSDVPYLSYEGIAGYLPEGGLRRIWMDAYDESGRLLTRTRSVAVRG